jgi:hypothetical protein
VDERTLREYVAAPVAAVRAYLDAAHIVWGPLWRGFDKRDKPLPGALSYRSVWQILRDRANAAGVPDVSWPGLRFGFIEAAAKLPYFELQKRAHMSDRYELRRQLQRGRAQRRASAAKMPERTATVDMGRQNVTKGTQKPRPITWQTVLDVRADLERLISSEQKWQSPEDMRHPRPRATFRPGKLPKQRRDDCRRRRYTQADVAEVRSELTRLYRSKCSSLGSSS